jgi:hypothetical protein
VASFLVLENVNDFKRLNLEAERGKTLRGDLGAFVAGAWDALGREVSARQTFQQLLTRTGPRLHLEGPQGAEVRKLLGLLRDADFELPAGGVEGGLVHAKDVPARYLAGRDRDRGAVHVYLEEARRRGRAGDVDGAVRVLSSVVEEHAGRGEALRLVGYRLLDLKRPAQAARLFGQVQRQRPFEPHSYRDLARALEDAGKPALAALQQEVVLAGDWHGRFGDALKVVAQEEYAGLMREALRRQSVRREVADYFRARLRRLAEQEESDLRVTISWNTDATDVDLWVIEPDGTKCFYGHARTHSGGELSQDQTQGYGPERYRIRKALPGGYRVVVHNFRPNPNLLGGETHVHVVVTRYAGMDRETVERHTVILGKADEQVEVCRVKF